MEHYSLRADDLGPGGGKPRLAKRVYVANSLKGVKRMKTSKGRSLVLLTLLVVSSLLLASCDSVSQTQEPTSATDREGTSAIVESVSIEEMMAHQYAVVNGSYPDACTKISNVEQVIEGNTFTITLYTDKPAGLSCAQMISPFTVNILLELGGQAPGDYTVNVNDSVSTVFTIGN
jgi:hypothetical protein